MNPVPSKCTSASAIRRHSARFFSELRNLDQRRRTTTSLRSAVKHGPSHLRARHFTRTRPCGVLRGEGRNRSRFQAAPSSPQSTFGRRNKRSHGPNCHFYANGRPEFSAED